MLNYEIVQSTLKGLPAGSMDLDHIKVEKDYYVVINGNGDVHRYWRVK